MSSSNFITPTERFYVQDSVTSWADFTPWFFAIAGVFTSSKGISKLLSLSSREAAKEFGQYIDLGGDLVAGIVTLIGFLAWFTQYDVSFGLAVSVGFIIFFLILSIVATAELSRRLTLFINKRAGNHHLGETE